MRPASGLIVLLTIFILSNYCFGEIRQRRQVTVVTNDDKKYTGKFIKADEYGVIMENDDGQTTIKLDRVKAIMFGDMLESSLPPVSGGITKSVKQRVELRGITFELIEAKMSGGSIICELMMTSNVDQNVYIASGKNRSKLYDEHGEEYILGLAQIGNKTGETVYATLIAGVPVNVKLRFINVPQEVRKITLLNVIVRGSVSFQFRNIPIIK